YVIEINSLLSDRINNCKEVFPLWINWTYIRDIFIMPDGLNEEGVADAAAVYYEHKRYYPYQMYINWPPSDEGNILHSDKKFVMLLYQWHRDKFTDYSKVSDAGDATKGGIYDFLQDSNKTVVVVDCENSDPYKLCATLRNLDENALNKIVKIILYDDIHSASAWKILGTYIKTPVEHILIERVKQNKSLVDIRLTGGAFREFYQNNVDSFIIASSDSDYWGLISSLPEARFLVMVEHGKCGPDIKSALASSGIFYCYLDDFYSGNANDLKVNALIREIYRYLDRSFRLNVNDMMEEAYRITRAEMSDAENQQFYNKYIKPMHLMIDKDGNVSIELKSK
ncbi:MAG: NYN domain-containing protein, partial [Bacillota bacterium]